MLYLNGLVTGEVNKDMEGRTAMKKENYDMPIEKPFGELPVWFLSNLNSRLVTKRFPKGHDIRRGHERQGRSGRTNDSAGR
jgi:hypothetical protein